MVATVNKATEDPKEVLAQPAKPDLPEQLAPRDPKETKVPTAHGEITEFGDQKDTEEMMAQTVSQVNKGLKAPLDPPENPAHQEKPDTME